MVSKGPRRPLKLAAKLGSCGFGGMEAVALKRLWRVAEALCCERPREAIGEGASSVTVETTRLKGLWNETKA